MSSSSWAAFPESDSPNDDTNNEHHPMTTTTRQDDSHDSDPWSTDAWGNHAWGDPNTFHSAASVTYDSLPPADGFDMMSLDIFADISAVAVAADDGVLSSRDVHVALHEQLSSLYDGSEVPESEVVGSIHVRPENGFMGSSFSLVVKDPSNQVEQFQQVATVCKDVTETFPHSVLDVGDKVLRVSLPAGEFVPKQRTVARYTCGSSVHPIPLLVKSKVQFTNEYCRVGIKMRANPTNQSALTNGAILLAVPPDIKGESVKTSLVDSVWDGMKRVVAWSIAELQPGESMEVQAQFEFVTAPDPEAQPGLVVPKFPVLVRFDATNVQFSDVELNTDIVDNHSTPVQLKMSRTVRILHRKV